MSILVAVYLITALWLAVYAFNAWVLTALYLKHRRTPILFKGEWLENDLPPVTVQLPIFNEALVIERLIEAIARLDYPAHLLQIQVLDDSTDDTTEIALAKVVEQRRQGINIELLHRTDRTGFKAGALKAGLETASGQFIAIFDADFVPEPDFLRQTVPHLLVNPQVGFVQTRWGHLNRDYSLFTAIQALAVDGHFVIEQTARQRSGLIMGFNGTGGIWRRSCIEAAGGWQGDTIAEDLDLSYRAQLAGWKPLFLPDVVAPAEIPPQLAAFKRQQFRWAKGSIQCLKKLGWQVLRAPLPWTVKWQAMVHLSSYLAHPLMVLLAVITPILMLTGGTSRIHFPLIYLSLLSLGPPLMYAVAQITLYPTGWRQHYKVMPLLIFLGGGIALSNTRAVIEALLGVGNVFRRTPKFNLAAADRWQSSAYRLPADRLAFGELALGLYSLVSVGIAAFNGNAFAIPFILLYAFGFGYVGLQGVWEARLVSTFKVERSKFRVQPSNVQPANIQR
ncbi:MAG: glycosyltransferase [Anaerolineales bacterium]|nr:glycosyltransferase [Anaerolineales bacterium]